MLNQNDLTGFQQTAQANNLFSQIAPSILGTQFNTQTWSPGTSAAVNFGKALLGGLANNYGKQQVADQVSTITPLLSQLYSNPMSVENPGVDETAFSALKNKAVVDNLLSQKAQEVTKQSAANDLISSIFTKSGGNLPPEMLDKLANQSTLFKDMGLNSDNLAPTSKIEGLLDSYSNQYPELKDPKVRASINDYTQLHDYLMLNKDTSDKDNSKLEERLTRELEKKGTPYQFALSVSPLLDNADKYVTGLKTGTVKPDPQADLNLIDTLNKVVNPGGILRAQLVNQVHDAQNPLNAFAGEFDRVLGGGSFNDETRNQIYNIIKNQGNELLNSGKSFIDNKLAVAKHKGLDDTSGIISPEYYNSLFGGLSSTAGAQDSSANTFSLQAQYNALRAQGKTPQEAHALLGK
jgi:hypothetical protein